MSGALCAVAAAKKWVDPTPPFSVDFFWNGPDPINVTGASGTTGNVVAAVVTNGGPNAIRAWTVLNDGNGHLNISGSGSGRNITYSGMTNGLGNSHSQTITVGFTYSDDSGNSFSSSISVTVVRSD